jgi:aspartate/methionine/tyrosine aminotransferase
MRVLAAAQERRRRGLPVYDLSAGQPATPAPEAVRKAAHRALDADRIGYTPTLGLPALREAIAEHYRRTYRLSIDPADVAVTTGSSGALQLAFLAAFDPGDTVAVTRPGYPAYRNMLLALGCRVVDVPLGPDYRLDVGRLDTLPDAPAGLVLASPANPTGTMLPAEDVDSIVRWCDRHRVRLLSDETYHGISYAMPSRTAWHESRSPVVLSSFSKYFSMTGWRLGWLLLPEELRDPVERLAANLTICPPTLSQYAAIEAFGCADELAANVARFRVNRQLLLDRLPGVGLATFAPPDGAFYIYADVSRWTADSLGWADRILTETGVALAPGVDFDRIDGRRHVRLCFAGDRDELATAVSVLGEWLARQPELAAAV